MCDGDGSSCVSIHGALSNFSYGYNFVVRIPAGASSIDIQQNARSGRRKDDNYIAVRDGGTGEYLVNGGFILSMFKKSIIYGDIIMDYTGSDVAKERLNSTKPIPKDLIVEVLTVGDLQQPNLTYSYLVPRDKLVEFRWTAGSRWTHCDKLCTGRIHCNKLSTRFVYVGHIVTRFV